MAMSDVLRFDCSIENEIARNETKNFARLLGKAFEQYKTLWNEYLTLRKYCEDANFNIPFQLLQLASYNDNDSDNKNVNESSDLYGCFIKSSDIIGNTLPESMQLSSSVCATPSNIQGFDVSSNLDDVYNQPEEDKLLSSPVLIKKRMKVKKCTLSSRSVPSDNSEESLMDQDVLMKENIPVLAKNCQQNEPPVEMKEEAGPFIDNNNDQVECTPLAKMPRKLRVSTLYNVETTFLKNGKRIRQSQFRFLSPEKSTERSEYENKSADEEIIQVSPNKYIDSNLRIKSSKIRRKTPSKAPQRNRKVQSVKNSGVKSPLKEKNSIGQSNLDRYISSTCNQNQSLFTNSKTFDFHNDKKLKENCDRNRCSSTADDLELMHFKGVEHLMTPVKKSNKFEDVRNIIQPEVKSCLFDQKVNINASTYNDNETFCMLGEKFEEIPDSKNLKKSPENNTSTTSSPVKRCLMDSFDVPSKKKNVDSDIDSKRKADRAKMSGVTCWECKKYYTSLGLSEEEIKTRQNQCSRHRSVFKEREGTPDGFWDPIFAETYMFTSQNN